jgi:hypothetical protein
MVGYAYILTHPGIPCLFWPHAVRMPGGSTVKSGMAADISGMCALRHRAGVRADSPVTIVLAQADLYVAGPSSQYPTLPLGSIRLKRRRGLVNAHHVKRLWAR